MFGNPRRFACLTFGCAVAAVVIAFPLLALAQALATAPPPLVVPWGDWLGASLGYLRDGIISTVVLLLGIAGRKLPGSIAKVIETARIEQLLTRAVDYAIATTAGAVAGKSTEIRVANALIRTAAEYALVNAPTLAARMGERLRPMIVARLSDKAVLPPDATAASLDAPLPAPAK